MDKESLSRKDQTKATRDTILEIAEKLFLTNNFDSVTSTEIAKKSNVAKGTIFHHFGSKDKLAIEVLNKVFGRFITEFKELKKSEEDGEKVLRTFLENMFNMVIEMPGITSLLLHLFTKMDDYDPEIRDDLNHLFQFMMGDFLNEFVLIFDKMGYENPEIKARILFGMVDGLGFQLHFEKLEDSAKKDELVNELINEILSMILTKEG